VSDAFEFILRENGHIFDGKPFLDETLFVVLDLLIIDLAIAVETTPQVKIGKVIADGGCADAGFLPG
jgi:hypothetical protein